jgi:Na+/alanine symporter
VAQVNGISTALKGSFNIPGVDTGIVVCALIAVIIYRRTETSSHGDGTFVPLMAAFYLIRRRYYS